MTAEGSTKKRQFNLDKEDELKFQVGGGPAVLSLKQGTAEIFGTELLQNQTYFFAPFSKSAIFSWHGCSLEISGDLFYSFVAKNNPMCIYLNTHAGIENRRQCAAIRGPRVMVAGPTDVGKSTYCRILLNYAVRHGRKPIFVDLDVGQGSISLPGTIGAMHVAEMADPVDGFQIKDALVFNLGHLSPGQNISFYFVLMEEMAGRIEQRCQICPEANSSGLIINTCGWVNGDGYASLVTAIEKFQADVVIVLDQEKLYKELHRDIPKFVEIVHQPKSPGVEVRDRSTRIATRNSRIRQYFQSHHSISVKFCNFKLFRIGLLPGEKSWAPEQCWTLATPILPTSAVVNHLLAVSQDGDIARKNILGFVCVTDVNMEEGFLVLLCPHPPPLPQPLILVYSDVIYVGE